MNVEVLSVDRLLRQTQPDRPRVLVYADDEAWSLTFRSLLGRPGFDVPETTVEWVRVSLSVRVIEEDSGESWLIRSIQPAPAIMVWDADSLRIHRIAKSLRRCEGLAPAACHVIVGRDLMPRCRMNWSALGALTTLRHPEDLWSQRRLIQRTLQQAVDFP